TGPPSASPAPSRRPWLHSGASASPAEATGPMRCSTATTPGSGGRRGVSSAMIRSFSLRTRRACTALPGEPMALTDQAIAKIKDLIVAGEFAPGDRLPKEKELADRLGLSRNSLREAVRALSLVGVLEARQGDGT